MSTDVNDKEQLLAALKEDRMTTKQEVIRALNKRLDRYKEEAKEDKKDLPPITPSLLKSLSFSGIVSKKRSCSTRFRTGGFICMTLITIGLC